jgi:hypothetical protein
MDELKARLAEIEKNLGELEAAARKLRNQNFADVAKSASGRVQQLSAHPDLELVHKELNAPEELPFDPKAGTEASQKTA